MNVSISRPDANYECMGHASENILSHVFRKNTSYKPNELSVTKANYASLTLWEKFTLTEYSNSSKNCLLKTCYVPGKPSQSFLWIIP